MSHTPTPWKLTYYRTTDDKIIYDTLVGPNGENIVSEFYPDNNEDAEFIVRAVNSHEALLEASKKVLSGCKKSLLFSPGFLSKLEKAIAQAEGEIK